MVTARFEGDVQICTGDIDSCRSGRCQTVDLGVVPSVVGMPSLGNIGPSDQQCTDGRIGSHPSQSVPGQFDGTLHSQWIGAASRHQLFVDRRIGRGDGPATLWPYRVAADARSTSTTTNEPATS